MAWIEYMRPPGAALTSKDIVFAVIFLLSLVYLFIGIAFASDIFMNAIETICGTRKTIKVTTEEEGVILTITKSVPVWNDTVANLTLMALGSSAPEILLSVIETLDGLGHQNPGDLGPGTIVGSAAYNLLVITSVCITCIGNGRISRIKMYKVFGVTTVTSLFAYIWMVIVLEWHTKDQVDLWEAVATFIFFPTLVTLAYWADRDFCIDGEDPKRASQCSSATSEEIEEEHREFFFGDDTDNLYDAEGNMNKAALQAMYTKLKEIAHLSPEEIASILATKLIQGKQHSRMWYRSQMTRTLMGGAKLVPVLNEKLKEVSDAITDTTDEEVGPLARKSEFSISRPSISVSQNKAVVEFQAATLAVSEGIGNATIVLYRSGKSDTGFQVNVESHDGTAKKGKEYEAVKETVTFDPYVCKNGVDVKIFDNVQWNPDSNFYLKMSIPAEYESKATVGHTRIIEIIIEDNDKPGKLAFLKRGYVFTPTQKLCYLEVERSNGTDGDISVEWKTIPGPSCKMIKEMTGKLEFRHKEIKKSIEIKFSKPNSEGDKVVGTDETFDVVLFSPEGGAKLGKLAKATCAISGDTTFKLEINDVITAAIQLSEEVEEEVSYKDQIKDAFRVNGGDSATATCKDYFFHCLTFPYKVIFSLIPPAHVWGGWPTFVLALTVVGFLTKIVGETATAFGLAIGLDPVITAITFVALGTSLPDTFASRISAMSDKTADNAVGNVTGSNSVNVFLGLGIPWTIAALFYKYEKNAEGKQEPYCVLAGSLTFNVLIYTICASISVGILTFRRYSRACGRAELGGPSGMKWITAIITFVLWIVYIFGSSLQVILLNSYGTDISAPFIGKKSGLCQGIIQKSKAERLAAMMSDQ